MSVPKKAKRHDHRRSLWIVANGAIVWCYRCGAWAGNWSGSQWQRPTGPDGENPAMRDYHLVQGGNKVKP